ncbi:MAPEG family protein [Acuticoccus yangtzensis]|uniref:MAPEG family protein n=1 Tax=Acuticoccus yangtzensis TaxID=1443441 RepID=UPI0009496208|nr:MAPEG family protein [Acuticoccus yangtzensis]
MTDTTSTELLCLAIAALLVVFSILAPAFGRLRADPKWASGNRDTGAPDTSLRVQRADRAARNIQETFPVFAALTLAIVATGLSSPLSAAGAVLYVVGRALYWPAYVFGLGPIRSLCYAAAMLGILLEFIALFTAVL